MSSLQEDIKRGCLADGEPLEAKWGVGYWSVSPDPEPDPWDGAPCPVCGNMLHIYAGEFAEDCDQCGWKHQAQESVANETGKPEDAPPF
jgi:hypothetical protein